MATRTIWPTMSAPTTARGRSRRRSTVCPPRRAAPIAVLRADTRDRRAVPRDGPLETLAQRRLRLEPEELPRAGGVDAPPRLTVRLGPVPPDVTGESGDIRYERGQIADRDLARGADVRRVRAAVALC